MDFVGENIKPSELIFTDYQSDLILGHYLCQQRPISTELSARRLRTIFLRRPPRRFHRLQERMDVSGGQFPESLAASRARPTISSRATPSGFFRRDGESDLPEDLQKHFAEFHDLRFESFGNNIKIFKMTVGQPMPAAAP